MKIIYATYVDHQKEIQYPLQFLLSKNKDIKVFCSDSENKDYLSSQGIQSEIIGVKINNPGDIAIAQNKCIDHIFSTDKSHFVVWIQADTHITEEGYQIIKDTCTEENIDKSFALNVKHLRLFHICQSDFYGVTIFGRDHKGRFVLDGAWTDHTGDDHSSRLGSECATIDIGYLTIGQCKRHLLRHRKTWNNKNEFLIKLAKNELSDKQFVQEYLKMCNVYGCIQKDDIYYKLMQEIGLVSEMNKTVELAMGGEYTKFGLLVYY